jgi:hypothetical protein
MTKKDFFRIIIKLFAIYYFMNILFNLPLLLFSFTTATKLNLQEVLVTSAVFSLIFILLLIFIKHTDLIISLLRLDKYFDDEHIVIGNFDAIKWAQFAIILLGGFLIINNLSDVLFHIGKYLQRKMSNQNIDDFDKYNTVRIAIRLLNLLIGYILITSNRSIARLFTVSKKDL